MSGMGGGGNSGAQGADFHAIRSHLSQAEDLINKARLYGIPCMYDYRGGSSINGLQNPVSDLRAVADDFLGRINVVTEPLDRFSDAVESLSSLVEGEDRWQ